jgi:hypothetical protein
VPQIPQGTDAHELEAADEVMDAIEQEEQEEQEVSSEQVDENDLIPT